MTDDILARSIRQAVRQPAVIEALCSQLEASLRASLGGSAVYVPKRMSAADREQRDQDLRTRWTGNNIDQLARETGLTTRQLRRIVRGPKK